MKPNPATFVTPTVESTRLFQVAGWLISISLPGMTRMDHSLSLIAWRDSVCAGDDCDAPHELSISVPRDVSVLQVAERFGGYLPSIQGGKATWILEGRRPLAVFAQQWSEPRFLVAPESPFVSLVDLDATPHLQFRYWCQVDPERVFDCLRRGQQLPDKYGR